jgi:hypothetical protein
MDTWMEIQSHLLIQAGCLNSAFQQLAMPSQARRFLGLLVVDTGNATGRLVAHLTAVLDQVTAVLEMEDPGTEDQGTEIREMVADRRRLLPSDCPS